MERYLLSSGTPGLPVSLSVRCRIRIITFPQFYDIFPKNFFISAIARNFSQAFRNESTTSLRHGIVGFRKNFVQ